MTMLKIQAETVILNQIKNYQGLAFQEFGDRLLSKLYPDEYIAVRAGGSWGDLKNDGYCHINRTFFHFYATSQNNVANLKAKITSDIKGCLEKQQQVERIVFVTNDSNLGVIEAHIDDLRLKHGIPIDTWGPNRLVEMICAMPPNDVAAICNMVVEQDREEGSMTVHYMLNANPYHIKSRKAVATKAWISVLCGIAFPLVLYYGYTPIPFGWYCLLLFVLLFSCLMLWTYNVELALKSRSSGDEGFEHWGVFYKKDGDKLIGYEKVAWCTYPHCGGIVTVEPAPEKEKERFKLVGCCNIEPKIHTFSYNDKNVGYPVQLDFSAKK